MNIEERYQAIMDFLQETDTTAIELIWQTAVELQKGRHSQMGDVTFSIKGEEAEDVELFYAGGRRNLLSLTTLEAIRVLSYMLR